MLHGDEFGPADWLSMLLAPPLAGAVIGLLLSRNRQRPGFGAVASAAGGTAGAWLGVALYRWLMDEVIGGRDINVFGGVTIGCMLVGAILPGLLVAGPKTTRSHAGPGCGLAIGGGVLAIAGVFVYAVACEPSSFIPIDESVKYVGIGCIVGGLVSLAIALARRPGS